MGRQEPKTTTPSSRVPPPTKVPLEAIRALVDTLLGLTGESPALQYQRHVRAAKAIHLAGFTPRDVEVTYGYIRRRATYLDGQPITMETIRKFITLATQDEARRRPLGGGEAWTGQPVSDEADPGSEPLYVTIERLRRESEGRDEAETDDEGEVAQ